MRSPPAMSPTSRATPRSNRRTSTVVAQRGHVMFMHNDDVHVDAAGFYGLGRTDKRNPIDDPVVSPDPDHPGQIHDRRDRLEDRPARDGAGGRRQRQSGGGQRRHATASRPHRPESARPLCRALPSHRQSIRGDDPATISDSSVVDTPGWGIVNHSSNVDVEGNVVFNAVGAAYVTEAGDEIGTFNGNIAIHSLGSGAGIESRQAGAGLRPSGRRLLAARRQRVGDQQRRRRPARQRLRVLPARARCKRDWGPRKFPVADLVNPAWAAPGQTMIDVGSVPLRKFKGNVAFASGDGLETWFTLAGRQRQESPISGT